MLSLVYFNGNIPKDDAVLIGLSLLVGTFFGQLILGVLGDRYGRRHVYGMELAILAIATMLMAIASKGALSGTNKVAWIASWRFIMGIGIGKLCVSIFQYFHLRRLHFDSIFDLVWSNGLIDRMRLPIVRRHHSRVSPFFLFLFLSPAYF
jgi:MFS family permease